VSQLSYKTSIIVSDCSNKLSYNDALNEMSSFSLDGFCDHIENFGSGKNKYWETDLIVHRSPKSHPVNMFGKTL
jgi:hypothetical protein